MTTCTFGKSKTLGFALLTWLAVLSFMGAAGVARAEVLAYYNFEGYRNNEEPDTLETPTDGFKMTAAVTGTLPNGPFSPNPAQDFMPNVLSNRNRLYGFHPDTIGVFRADTPHPATPFNQFPNAFSWDISTDRPDSAAQGVRDLYDVPQGGDNSLRSGLSGATSYTFEISFKQSIQRGFQALIGRDYSFVDSFSSNIPSGSARATSRLGNFFLGLAANDGPGGDNQTRVHFYAFNQTGGVTITDTGQTGDAFFGVGPVIQPNVWYDLAAIGDGTNVNFYLKASSDGSFANIGSLPQSGLRVANAATGWTLGRGWFDPTPNTSSSGLADGGPADGFRGWIDEARFSNEALALEDLLADTDPVGLQGDYNNDGTVDAADYTVWRDGGSPDSTPAGYAAWDVNYGAANPAVSTAVPEPVSMGIAALAVLAGAAARRS